MTTQRRNQLIRVATLGICKNDSDLYILPHVKQLAVHRMLHRWKDSKDVEVMFELKFPMIIN
jgi:hypothetical protein